MEEKKDLTYIEFFDHSAVENICACLAQAPARVILLGDDREVLDLHCQRYEQLFHKRGFKELEFIPWPVEWDTLEHIVDSLSQLVETYENCVFGLTGGDDLYLVAMGIISECYKEKEVKMHRFFLEEEDVLDCDQDGIVVGQNRQPKLSVEENIYLYGGRVVYDNEIPDGTHRWNMNEQFRADLNAMWEICCNRGNRRWNEQMETLRCAAKAVPGSGLEIHVLRQRVENLLRSDKMSFTCNEAILQDLKTKGMLTHYEINDTKVELGFKNEQIKACLTSAGRLLELVAYMAALDARDEEGKKVYNNSLTGVYIDWDGELGSDNDGEDSHNEIDVIMMHGVIPVFVSCKNGYVSPDELYKLEVVAEQFGSSYAKKVLIAPALDSYGDHGAYIENRAEDMGIQVIKSLPWDDMEERNRIVSQLWREGEDEAY